MKLRPLALALSMVASTCLPNHAEAFSTRVHIMIANKVRDALKDANDGTIPLRFGDHAVILADEDVQALLDHPLAFRAGAVGPDNMVFPGMTDPSHALGQRPFEQCELLYQEAVLPEERAYALGCFLHGSTDAVAHHYVNFMTGETFTLTPITSGRTDSYDNVVRHILAESAIQRAAVELDAAAFGAGELMHAIPVGFVLRTYLKVDNPVWQMMAAHPKAEYDKAVADNPGAPLTTIVAAMDVAPADHLVLSPVYLGAIDDSIAQTKLDLEAKIAGMQDPGTPEGAELLVTPGPDGVLGTKDDETDCAFTCPQLFSEYFTYVGLLAPRYNAQMQPLPSAFEKITEELRAELFSFHTAYMETVANLSAKLNEPPNAMNGEFGLTKADVSALFAPMTGWADKIETIDYDTLVYAIIPDWIIELDTLMQSVGLDIDLAALIKAVFQPIVQPIKDAIYGAFIAQAEVFLGDLIAEIEAKKDVVYAEYDMRLAAAADPKLGGDVLDHFYDSGLFGHAFNIAATAIAEHAAVLPVGEDPIGIGPASFDASYTPAWMQAGACDYLAEAVFPLGIDVRGTLSVRNGDGDFVALVDVDSPVECHDGSLLAFAGAPGVAACVVTKLAALLEDPVGSVSRAYPPAFAAKPAVCNNTAVPGLPDPPPGGDTDTTGGTTDTGTDTEMPTTGEPTGGGGSGGSGGGVSSVSDSAGTAGGDVDTGCGCRSQGSGAGGLAWALLGLWALRRTRRRRGGVIAGVALAGLTGCGDEGGGGTSEAASTGAGTTTSTSGVSTEAGTTTEGATTEEVTTSGTGSTGSGSASTGPGSLAQELLETLDGTVWHGEQTRAGLTRGYELRFDGGAMLWSELRNPYGPARLREMRGFAVADDGTSVHSVVVQPQDWPVHPENGREDDWTIEVIEGEPRVLRTTREGAVEDFVEGPWPAPVGGLTAVVRVFKVGGAVDKAFCDSGASGFDYPTLFAFARGESDEIVASDAVAGARLLKWTDPSQNNQFSVNDVEGFERLGGTELSDTFNFFVTYSGTLQHAGGPLALREADDSVEDAVWVFMDGQAGVGGESDLFLEVQGFAWPDATPDAPSADVAAGEVPIEAIVVRCTEAIKDVDVQIRADADWLPLGAFASASVIDDTWFPPTF